MVEDIKHWEDNEQNGLPPNPVEWTNAADKLWYNIYYSCNAQKGLVV